MLFRLLSATLLALSLFRFRFFLAVFLFVFLVFACCVLVALLQMHLYAELILTSRWKMEAGCCDRVACQAFCVYCSMQFLVFSLCVYRVDPGVR